MIEGRKGKFSTCAKNAQVGMKKLHPMKMLEEICELNMGQSPESSSYNQDEDGLPFYQGNADFGDLHPVTRYWCNKPTKIAKFQDLLISVRAPIGALNIATEICCIGRGLAALTAKKGIAEGKYVYYALRKKHSELNAKGTGSTFKAITKTVLSETLIPLPPLAEQERIAAVLDQASELIALRRRQIEKLDLLVKARFVEMFGDPVTNPMGWEKILFSEAAEIDTNMTTDFFSYANLPHIGIDCIEKDSGKIVGYKLVKDSDLLSGKYLFDERHIIYSKIRPNLNKVAIPNFKGLCSADAYPILPKKSVNKYYLALLLRSEYFLSYILSHSDRTNIPKVNKKQLSLFAFPLPPILLQAQFAAFVEQVEEQRALMLKGVEKLELNYKALMQGFFG